MMNQKTRGPLHTSGIVSHSPLERKIDQWDTGGPLERDTLSVKKKWS